MVSRNRKGFLRLLNRHVISSRYAGRCFVETLCHGAHDPALQHSRKSIPPSVVADVEWC